MGTWQNRLVSWLHHMHAEPIQMVETCDSEFYWGRQVAYMEKYGVLHFGGIRQLACRAISAICWAFVLYNPPLLSTIKRVSPTCQLCAAGLLRRSAETTTFNGGRSSVVSRRLASTTSVTTSTARNKEMVHRILRPRRAIYTKHSSIVLTSDVDYDEMQPMLYISTQGRTEGERVKGPCHSPNHG